MSIGWIVLLVGLGAATVAVVIAKENVPEPFEPPEPEPPNHPPEFEVGGEYRTIGGLRAICREVWHSPYFGLMSSWSTWYYSFEVFDPDETGSRHYCYREGGFHGYGHNSTDNNALLDIAMPERKP